MTNTVAKPASAGMRISDGADSRRAQRHKTFLVGTLAGRDQPVRCHVLNISNLGAQVHCQATFAKDALVTLRSADLAIRSQVVWAQDGRYGLAFMSPASDAAIAKLFV